MAKKRKRQPPRRTARRTPSPTASDHRANVSAQQPLLDSLREALRDPDPTAFWGATAPIVGLVADPMAMSDHLPEGVDMLQTFIDVDVAETTALLHMVAAMTPNDLLRQRARQALTTRRQPLPPSVTGLEAAVVSETQLIRDADIDSHLIELTLPNQVRATLVSAVRTDPWVHMEDAFVVGASIGEVLDHFEHQLRRDGSQLTDFVRPTDPAQARASLEQALEPGRLGHLPAPEAEQLTMARPLVEFVLRLMPTGGSGYDDDVWMPADPTGFAEIDDDEELFDWDLARRFVPVHATDGTDLVEAFLAAPQATQLTPGTDTKVLVTYLLNMGAAQEGDPLHWCSRVIGLVLTEEIPVDPFLPELMVDEVAAVLPALVSWAYDCAEPTELPATIVAAMESGLAELTTLREDPRRRATRHDLAVEVALHSGDLDAFSVAMLIQQVGGERALGQLTTEPLPVESMDVSALPPDLADRLGSVDSALVAGLQQVSPVLARHAPGLVDEFLTACRRFLAQATRLDPAVLRRRARTQTTAAAIAWIVGRGNQLVGYQPAPIRSGDLMDAFGVTSTPSGRAQSLQSAAAIPRGVFGVALGSPHLLVSSARRDIIARRDRLMGEDQASR